MNTALEKASPFPGIALVLPLTAVLALPAGEQSLEYAPAADAQVQRTVVYRGELALASLETEVNGETIEPEGEFGYSFQQEFVMTDRYGNSEEGRLLGLTRRFDSLVSTGVGSTSAGEQEMEEFSELNERTIAFRWDADEEEYTASFADGEEGDPELLEELDVDADASFLLPDGAVESGESWQLSPGLLERVFDLSGELHFVDPEQDEDFEDPLNKLIDEARSNFEGAFTATFNGTSQIEGLQLASIQLVADVAGVAEDDQDLEAVDQEGNALEGSTTMEVEAAFDLEGVLLWDVSANRMHSLELQGDVSITNHATTSLDIQGEPFEASQRTVLEGEFQMSCTVQSI